MIDTRICRFDAVGGPEVLAWHNVSIGVPGAGELLIRHTAVGLNYIDTYHRSGLYPLALPSGIGLEAAGVVESVGPDVSGFAAGDRIGYFLGPIGAYSTHRLLPARNAVLLPGTISDEVAAASLLKGCTTEFLVERCAKVQPGQTILVQAAAGGVGLMLVRWLKAIGATVIATAGGTAKTRLAADNGADHVIDYNTEAVAPRVRDLTNGRGVDVVFDGVGNATWDGSIDSLARRGLHVSFGNASGPVGAVDFGLLGRKGSLFTTRPTLFDYYSTREDLVAGTSRLFGMIDSGAVTIRIDQSYGLFDAESAHRDLEARRTTGSTVLVP